MNKDERPALATIASAQICMKKVLVIDESVSRPGR